MMVETAAKQQAVRMLHTGNGGVSPTLLTEECR